MSQPPPGGRPARRILLTGATGLLGSSLLRVLLERGHEVRVLARRRDALGAAERVSRILATLLGGERPLPQSLRVIETDGRCPVRLSGDLDTVDAVIHAAAAVKFDSTIGDLETQNIRGTLELLGALDRAAPHAEFHFVSSAYACGTRHGTVRETLEIGPASGFRHPYEETKQRAETAVVQRCRETGRRFTIHRPSIIAGDSGSGLAANFNGIYAILRCADLVKTRLSAGRWRPGPLYIRCNPLSTKNVVPVDWVARSIATLVESGSDDRAYHLTHPRPIRHIDIRDVLERLTASEIWRLHPLPGPAPGAGALQRAIDRSLERFGPYLWDEPEFDRAQLVARLGAGADPPPIDGAYLGRLFDYARATSWDPHPLELPAAMVACLGAAPGSCATRSLQ